MQDWIYTSVHIMELKTLPTCSRMGAKDERKRAEQTHAQETRSTDKLTVINQHKLNNCFHIIA